MANNYNWILLQEAFTKVTAELDARGEKNITKTLCASELAYFISEETRFAINERTLRNYWNALEKNPNQKIPQQEVLDGLSKYLGYDTYVDFTISKTNTVSIRLTKNWKLFFFVFILIFTIGFALYQYGTKTICMIWEEDHFEKINCDLVQLENGSIINFDERLLLNFKKVHQDSIKTFFTKDHDPLIWYGKNFKGEYEYFTALGFHPETGKTLKPITDYIIDKYIKKTPK